jgi:biopolymer transport protein TolR
MGASLANGGNGNGGRRRRARRHAPMSEINVTPFVDVMLVLLIIFMVAAPMMTSGVPLDLPSLQGKQLETPKLEPIQVSVRKDGAVFLGQEDKEPTRLEDLGTKVKAIVSNRPPGEDPLVFVRGDTATNYGNVARVIAELQKAGFRKVSLLATGERGG